MPATRRLRAKSRARLEGLQCLSSGLCSRGPRLPGLGACARSALGFHLTFCVTPATLLPAPPLCRLPLSALEHERQVPAQVRIPASNCCSQGPWVSGCHSALRMGSKGQRWRQGGSPALSAFQRVATGVDRAQPETWQVVILLLSLESLLTPSCARFESCHRLHQHFLPLCRVRAHRRSPHT